MHFITLKHLLCDIHMKDNKKKKLSDLNIKGPKGKGYLYDIFGKQIQSEKVPVLRTVPMQRNLTRNWN